MNEVLEPHQLDVLNTIAHAISWSLGESDKSRQEVAILGCKQLMRRHSLDSNDITAALFTNMTETDNIASVLNQCLALLPENYQRVSKLYSVENSSLVKLESQKSESQQREDEAVETTSSEPTSDSPEKGSKPNSDSNKAENEGEAKQPKQVVKSALSVFDDDEVPCFRLED